MKGDRRRTPAWALARSAQLLREEGLVKLGWRILGELGYRRLLMLECPLEPTKPAPPAVAEIRKLGAEARDELIAARPSLRGEARLGRLGLGQECFAAYVDGAIAGIVWASPGVADIPYLGLNLPLAADEVYFDDGWTSPAHRRLGLAHALTATMLEHYRERGFRSVISSQLPENRVWEETGFRAYERIGIWRVGGRRFVRRRALLPASARA